MANETRLQRALQQVQNEFAYIIIDTPPNTGDLLINSLVAADLRHHPGGDQLPGCLRSASNCSAPSNRCKTHFRPDLKILGYLPTMCEEQRSEAQEILAELQRRSQVQKLVPIHKASDLAYAHSSHMDIFTYRPPRVRTSESIVSSSRATHEYAELVDLVTAQDP